MPSPIHASSAARTSRQAPSTSSTTTTVTQTATSTPVLRLRATAPPQETRRPRIQWADDVIDNEGLGRKRSKVCCIYHAPRAVGESSDESSSSDSSSDNESGSDNDDGGARMAGMYRKGKQRRQHPHDHEPEEDHEDCKGHAQPPEKKAKRKKSRNAYEKLPKINGGRTTVTETTKS